MIYRIHMIHRQNTARLSILLILKILFILSRF